MSRVFSGADQNHVCIILVTMCMGHIDRMLSASICHTLPILNRFEMRNSGPQQLAHQKVKELKLAMTKAAAGMVDLHVYFTVHKIYRNRP
jgi:hypothetical protein